jgi:cobalt-zinc-cadmium efflux system outer membrane protein
MAGVLLLGGCASTSPRASFEEVSRQVEQRSGHALRWDQGTPEDAQAERATLLLGHDLSLEQAVQVALLHNPQLRATYEGLGVAQADLVQAGLLKNPSFGVSVRFPQAGRGSVDTEFSLVQDFLDLFTLPLRKRVAEAELARAKLRVGAAVLQTVAEVKEAYYRLAAAQQLLELRRAVVGAQQATAELSRRQREAGNISELTLLNEQLLHEQSRAELARSEAEGMELRERLTRLLGAWGAETEWKVTAPLPPIAPGEVPLEHLEALAVGQRLDLDVARQESLAVAQALELTQDTRWFSHLDVGVNTERGTDGLRVTGPTLGIELPVFDQHQAAIARLEAEARAARARQDGLAVAIRSEVRVARQRLLSARALAEHYRTVLIPLRERAVALSQQSYNAMLIGVYQLVQTKQDEVATYREYLETVRDYWLARTDLELAVGGRLAAPTLTPASTP